MPAESGTDTLTPSPPPMLDAQACIAGLPARSELGHKFSFGVVMAVAGSLDYAGAAFMTGLGAIRAGAGMVCLAVPDSLRPLFAGRLPETIVAGLPESGSAVDSSRAVDVVLEREPAAIVIGPGLKESNDYRALTVELVARAAVPVVIDAGALAMLGDAGDWWTAADAPCVLTPHAGEFRRLTGRAVSDADEDRADACRSAADRFGQVVVLKGARTVIASPDGRSATSPFVNPLLATAGSGDVLAGFIAGLLGQGADPFGAACTGVYLHGLAGDRISARLGNSGLMATELPLEMALARNDLLRAGSSGG